MVHRAVAMLRHHAAALLLLALVSAIGQVAVLGENPLAFFGPDSFTYIRAAGKLSTALWHVDSLRTAGYPFFLMMLFKLTGGVNYDLAGVCFGGAQGGTVNGQCQTMFYPIIVAQALVMLVTILECYILAYQLSHRRVVACVAASLIGCNIPIISWERTVYSEMLATTTIVTLFLCYLYFARRPRIWSAVLLGVLTFWAVLISRRGHVTFRTVRACCDVSEASVRSRERAATHPDASRDTGDQCMRKGACSGR